MGFVITGSPYVMSEGAGFTPDHPIIGIQNAVTTGNIVADTTATGYPATNLANPASFLRWRAANFTTQFITITSSQIFDYVALSFSNLASSAIQVSVETGGGPWTSQTTPQVPAENGTVIMRFTPINTPGIRIRLASGAGV